ncbi:hypothetical protein QE152_g5302 [Popillia japonica]|uniref:Uncharacterized protein n=1 Tax=Popillia japonica TaxID=7064 RepID=A0AAW1MIW5_POPJA
MAGLNDPSQSFNIPLLPVFSRLPKTKSKIIKISNRIYVQLFRTRSCRKERSQVIMKQPTLPYTLQKRESKRDDVKERRLCSGVEAEGEAAREGRLVGMGIIKTRM